MMLGEKKVVVESIGFNYSTILGTGRGSQWRNQDFFQGGASG